MNIVVPACTCFLFTLNLRIPNKDELFYVGDKVIHYYFHYQIQVPDRHVCDRKLFKNSDEKQVYFFIFQEKM